MKRLMHGFQASVIDVRVNLRRCDTRMSQELLHLAKISAAGQQMGGKTVT